MCGDVRIDAIRLEEAAARVASGSLAGAVHLCNAYTIALASRDSELADVLAGGALNLADGMPVTVVARCLGFDLPERVYGPDLMERVFELTQASGTKHYLFGGTPTVLEALRSTILSRWPSADVCGAVSPAFSDELVAFEAGIAPIMRSGAQIVWVGLGTPKQDFVAARIAQATGCTVVAVGAAFDFLAGAKRQAPRFVQRAGLEWLFRMMLEPRRLWRRYVFGNTRFLALLVTKRPRRIPGND